MDISGLLPLRAHTYFQIVCAAAAAAVVVDAASAADMCNVWAASFPRPRAFDVAAVALS